MCIFLHLIFGHFLIYFKNFVHLVHWIYFLFQYNRKLSYKILEELNKIKTVDLKAEHFIKYSTESFQVTGESLDP